MPLQRRRVGQARGEGERRGHRERRQHPDLLGEQPAPGERVQRLDDLVAGTERILRRIEQREHYRHAVGTCERCHTRIEPLITLQWWCEMKDLAARQMGL
jgi:hypothetical protein